MISAFPLFPSYTFLRLAQGLQESPWMQETTILIFHDLAHRAELELKRARSARWFEYICVLH
eukprot:6542943-Pyramimonas_sp.AAC.1